MLRPTRRSSPLPRVGVKMSEGLGRALFRRSDASLCGRWQNRREASTRDNTGALSRAREGGVCSNRSIRSR